ncbi:MAG: TusE/DsrC/DsvC family sulfur relay protein [candidate division KSB1 bacterium]|nr:TusE/DsrC/DsvC family sulfur relay protein [candidate division KSB1 bacterium]MDZ7304317.1 TusE/DsrC/DsvC family sulfur relay protein [candidate division KSB1 bacterium]MDZ7313593.1 TusE/DsrC/DsvC family sulfur relay protein [candidate division KSB1 bacterium]
MAFDLKQVKLDADGFLADPNAWTEELAKAFAIEEGIPNLTERHWQVINFMRQEYKQKAEVPTIRRLKNAGGIPTKELYELFPNGPAKKAARIAGLPKPQGCV